jgi:hypothetical protein
VEVPGEHGATAYLVRHLRVLASEVKRLAAAAAGGRRDALSPPHQGLEARADAPRASAVCRRALPAARIVVATLNLWNVNGDWPARRSAVAAALRAAGADLVALQEVRYAGTSPAAGGMHQLAELAALLPELAHTAYLPVGPMDVGHEEGLGVRHGLYIRICMYGETSVHGR